MTYTYETEAATEDERGVKLGVATAEWLRAALGHGIQYTWGWIRAPVSYPDDPRLVDRLVHLTGPHLLIYKMGIIMPISKGFVED